MKRIIATLALMTLAACGGGGKNSYSVGGVVAGLKGSGLTLRNNGGDDLLVTGDGAFTFKTPLATSVDYHVTVFAQPSQPSQTCTVAGGDGHWAGSSITSVAVTCVTNTYHVTAMVTGLSGSGLVLENNGTDDLAVSANGPATFTTMVASGAAYRVSIRSQPSSSLEHCIVMNAGSSGLVGSTDVDTVAVACSPIARFAYVASEISNNISGYTMAATTGALSPMAGSPFLVVTTPTELHLSVATGVAGPFVYAENWFHGANTPSDVFGFAIDAGSGALAPLVGSPFPSPGSTEIIAGYRLVVDSQERSAYAVSIKDHLAGIPTGEGQIEALRINASDGSLTSLEGSNFDPGGFPEGFDVAIGAKWLYVACPPTGLWAYAIDGTTGALAPVAGNPVATGVRSTLIALEPSGRFVYVGGTSATGTGALAVLTIDPATGALTPIPSGPIALSAVPRILLVDPSGSFLYVIAAGASAGADEITPYALDASTGAANPIAAAPRSLGATAAVAAFDPSGQFLLVVGTDPTGTLGSEFTLDANTGALAPVANSPFTMDVQGPVSLNFVR